MENRPYVVYTVHLSSINFYLRTGWGVLAWSRPDVDSVSGCRFVTCFAFNLDPPPTPNVTDNVPYASQGCIRNWLIVMKISISWFSKQHIWNCFRKVCIQAYCKSFIIYIYIVLCLFYNSIAIVNAYLLSIVINQKHFCRVQPTSFLYKLVAVYKCTVGNIQVDPRT